MQKTKKTSSWKKLALTSEEIEGMPRDKIRVHLSEQVTTPMPWTLEWIGRHKKFLFILFSVIILMIGAGIGIGFAVSVSELSFGAWFVNVILKGFVWFLVLIFAKIIGWVFLVLPIAVFVTILFARKLVKRNVIVIARYGTGRKKSYTIASTDEGGHVLGVWRQNFLGNLIFGLAKAQISASTWEYIQQNAKPCTHKLLGIETLEYKLLYVLPEEYSNEPILKRINQELVLNPKSLIRQEDVEELILHNTGKKKGEQLANDKILYNLTELTHKQQEEIRTLQVKVRNAPEDALQEFARTMMPETTELFYNTYTLLSEKKRDLTPFDSIEAELEAVSKKIKEGNEEVDPDE